MRKISVCRFHRFHNDDTKENMTNTRTKNRVYLLLSNVLFYYQIEYLKDAFDESGFIDVSFA